MNYKDNIVNKNFVLLLYLYLFVFVPSLSFAASKNGDVFAINNPVLNIIFTVIFFILAVFFLGTPIWILVLLYFGYKKYLKIKVRRYCEQNGLKYVDQSTTIPYGNDFKLVNLADNRNFTTVMVGSHDGIPFMLGEYNFKTSGNQEIRYYNVVICVMVSDQLDMPHFYLSETEMKTDLIFKGKMVSSLSRFKKVFFSYNDFDYKLTLRADDESMTKAFFNDKIRKLFIDTYNTDYICEGYKNCLMLCYPSPATLEQKIEMIDNSAQLLSIIIDNRF